MGETREKYKRQRDALYLRQEGKCYWCDRPMLRSWEHVNHEPTPRNLCTMEHLDDRYSQMRGKYPPGTFRRVAACLDCNNKRSALMARTIPVDELRERSSRHPINQAEVSA